MRILRSDPTTNNQTGDPVSGVLSEAKVAEMIQGALGPLMEQLKGMNNLLSKPEKTPPAGQPAPDKGTPGANGTPQENAQIHEMRRTLDGLNQKVEQATKREKEASLRALASRKDALLQTELAKFEFVSEAAKADAATLLGQSLEWDQEGENLLNTKENLPASAFITKFVDLRPNLLKPVPTGGSGPAPGSPRQGKQVSLETIRPGMSDEDLSAAFTQVAGLVQQYR
jgi:hypothetical protein